MPSQIELSAKRAELVAERERLRVEAEQVSDRMGDKPSKGDQERFDNLIRGVEKLNREIAQNEDEAREALTDAVKRGTVSYESAFDPPTVVRRGDPWGEVGPETPVEARSRALTAIERWDAGDELKESATATVERLGQDDKTGADAKAVASHIVRFSSPLYVSAFRKFAADPETFAAELTPDERQVWAAARHEARAVLQTSGAVLPSPLDPTIVLTNNGAIDPMRGVARVDTTAAKEKRYITSAGSTFSFDAELAEVSDDTFTEAEVTITNHKAQGFIQASLEVWADQPGFDLEVAKIIADGKARLEASKWVTGTGTNEPKGIEVALAGGASEINAAGEALVANDVYGLIEALPPRFRQNAQWQLELSTLNFIARLYNPSGTEPALIDGNMLLRRPYVENSSVDPYSAVNAAATATNRVLFVGDWQNYVICDRVGMTVQFIPVMFNTANNLPDGRVGWYCHWRTGADVLTIAAFRMLDVQTTA